MIKSKNRPRVQSNDDSNPLAFDAQKKRPEGRIFWQNIYPLEL